MANPFEAFRKHQAVMLAVFGVLIVLVFTVGDSLTKMLGGGDGVFKDPVVVTWAGGEMHRSDLDSEIQKRDLVARVLIDLQGAAYAKANIPEYVARSMAQLRIVSQRDLNPDATFRYMTLLRKADQLGVHVSDEAVFAYLDSLTRSPFDGKEQFDSSEMNQLIERPGGRRRTSTKIFVELLRNEMKAREVGENLFLRGYQWIPPGELLTYYTQIEKQVDAELIAIPVDAFVDNASAPPSDAELEKYFQKYKGDLPSYKQIGGTILRSAEPGFKRSYKTVVEFIRFSHDEFIDRAREEIEKDEEKIKEFYERHKDTNSNLQVSDDVTVTPDGDATAEGESTAENADGEADAEAQEKAEGEAKAEDGAKAEGDAKPEDDAKAKDDEKDAIRYKPLDEVRDYIVLQLSTQRASTLIDETLDPLKNKMDEHSQYARVGSERSLKELAASTGLTVHRSESFSVKDFQDNTEIGSVPGFLSRVFSNQGPASLRNAGKIKDYDNNNFLFWKVEETPEVELELKDVRDEVVRSWKSGAGRAVASNTAQELAVAAANKMADQLRGGSSMADVAKGLPGSQTISTGLFSWYSPPTAEDPAGGTAVTLSTIDGIDSPGPEFMRAAFGLGVGEVAVATNYPRTMVYVIRVKSAQPSDEKLRADFLEVYKTNSIPSGISEIARYEVGDTVRAWYSELDKEFGVEWEGR